MINIIYIYIDIENDIMIDYFEAVDYFYLQWFSVCFRVK